MFHGARDLDIDTPHKGRDAIGNVLCWIAGGLVALAMAVLL